MLTWRGADELMERTIAAHNALLYRAGLDLVGMASERPDEIEPIPVRSCEIECF